MKPKWTALTWGLVLALAAGTESASAQRSQRRQSKDERPPQPVSSSNTGYIDNAIVGTQIRIRYDNAFGNVFPDRAEFFYAKCGCYRPNLDPFAPGPVPDPPDPQGRVVETEIDYLDIRANLEYAFNRRFSWFVEVPFRYLKPEVNENAFGIADIQTGVKLAAVASPERYLTAQLRVFIPTGEAIRGLGTDHATVEPALLYLEKLSDRLTLESELAYWHPTSGSSTVGVNADPNPEAAPPGRFSGDVIRYGVGLSYNVSESEWSVSPVLELIGWTVRDGFKTRSLDGIPDPPQIAEPANGDTILNLKVGLRLGPLYFGYGRSLTKDFWYNRIFRIEYRFVY